jgi:hypothetical protein
VVVVVIEVEVLVVVEGVEEGEEVVEEGVDEVVEVKLVGTEESPHHQEVNQRLQSLRLQSLNKWPNSL